MELYNALPLTTQYYEAVFGYWPDKQYWLPTLQTVWYLKINGLEDSQICRELKKHSTMTVAVQDLSDSLWEDSLTKKGRFYFHHELQIISPQPSFSFEHGTFTSTVSEFWCVPRLSFTYDDLTSYFYKQFSKHEAELYMGHNDRKTVDYLLNRFGWNFPDMEALDILLCLIDEMGRDENRQNKKGLISVTDYVGNVIETLRNTYREAEAKGLKKPWWPSC